MTIRNGTRPLRRKEAKEKMNLGGILNKELK